MPQPDATTRDTLPKPKRRWLQYSLRTLLILTTIIAIWLGWWSYKARQQRDIVAVLRKKGTDVAVAYDFHMQDLDGPRYWPGWLVNAMGVDYFANVACLELFSTRLTDADLDNVRSLTALQRLVIDDTQVTNAGLERLKGHTTLNDLILPSQVTDAELVYLKELPALNRLTLSNTQITDAGLTHLAVLTRLQFLDLSQTKVTDAGLYHLNGLTSLELLGLEDTDVTDAGVEGLQKALPKCKISR